MSDMDLILASAVVTESSKSMDFSVLLTTVPIKSLVFAPTRCIVKAVPGRISWSWEGVKSVDFRKNKTSCGVFPLVEDSVTCMAGDGCNRASETACRASSNTNDAKAAI